MRNRRLVENINYNPFDSCKQGKCPHFGANIDDYTTIEKCYICEKPVVWEWNQLTEEEKEAERKEYESKRKKNTAYRKIIKLWNKRM